MKLKSFGQCVLKVHETTHIKESLFCCETCGRQLRNKSSLIRHTKRHSLPNKPGRTVGEYSILCLLFSVQSTSWKNNTPLATIEYLDYVFYKHGIFNENPEYLKYSKIAYKEIIMQVVKHSVIQIRFFRSS